mgnify:CR=1 FL=1
MPGGAGSTGDGVGQAGTIDFGGNGGSGGIATSNGGQDGSAGNNYAAGGSGAAKLSGPSRLGGSGAQGLIRITTYTTTTNTPPGVRVETQ